jgi:hypothetical protein
LSVEDDLSWVAAAGEVEREWRDRGQSVIKRYRDERKRSEVLKDPRFNILFANTETMLPLLYSQTPKPDVRRRYRDQDPLAKASSQVIERSLEFFLDDEDNQLAFKRGTKDLLLPGRACIRVHYVPVYGVGDTPRIPVFSVRQLDGDAESIGYQTEDGASVEKDSVQAADDGSFYIDGEPEEEVVDERIEFERVPWDMVRIEPVRVWEEVTKMAFGSFMTRATLKKTFGRKGGDVQLNHSSKTPGQVSNDPNKKMRYALVWEIWDKERREVRCVAEGHDKYLRKTKDPLRLQKFFPTPKPLYAIDAGDTLVPTPHFSLYQDQADELDLITRRICKIVDAMRVRGFYAGEAKDEMDRVFKSEDNEMVPLSDWDGYREKGMPLDFMPLDAMQKALIGLYQQRASLIEQIYEIVGLADIMRGSTDPRETKGAQVLKSQFGSRRMAVMTKDTQDYFRDLLRMAGELLAEHCSEETLSRITGLPVTPEMKSLLKDDALRSYRIDIETDSTIAPDEQRDKEQAVEAIGAIAEFAGVIFPLVQAGQMSQEVAGEALKWLARKFRMGRDLEDFLNQQQNAPPQPPRDVEAEAKAQAEQQKTQAKLQEMQMKMQLEQQKFQMEMQMEMQRFQLEMEIERARGQAQVQNERIIGMAKAQATVAQGEQEPKENKEAA